MTVCTFIFTFAGSYYYHGHISSWLAWRGMVCGGVGGGLIGVAKAHTLHGASHKYIVLVATVVMLRKKVPRLNWLEFLPYC